MEPKGAPKSTKNQPPESLGAAWGLLGALGALLAALGALLGALGRLLGGSWALLGGFWRVLAPLSKKYEIPRFGYVFSHKTS